MKRKTLIALGLVALLVTALFCIHDCSPPRFVGAFSPADFKGIQRVIRQTMWRRAFPSFSMQTIAATPRSLWYLGTSRIEQMDIFPGGTTSRVRVRTPAGLYLILMQKSAPNAGPASWQIRSERLAGDKFVKEMESWGGFSRLAVKGGVGLRGGKLPALFVTPAVYPERNSLPSTEGLGLESTPIRLSFETHPVIRDGVLQPFTSRSDVTFSKSEFSQSLSNNVTLKLGP